MNYIDNVYHKFLFIISSNTRTKGCAMKLRDNKSDIKGTHFQEEKKKQNKPCNCYMKYRFTGQNEAFQVLPDHC